MEENIRIGKTVIETLTQGMYEDARFVFREYVQNSADAIDKAVEKGTLSDRKKGEIYIVIDRDSSCITIEDNGTGIEQKNVFAILGNIALSEKDRIKDKGFRGIGRLGGLAYCENLVFETSFAGEQNKTIMTWNAFELRQKLFDKNVKDDASEIVKSVVTIKNEYEDVSNHYFKVTLDGIDNDDLFDVEDIKEYLSMVVPVQYPTQFHYKTLIYQYAKQEHFEIDEYCIFLNGEQITKPYKTILYEETSKHSDLKKYDEIVEIKFFSFNNEHQEKLAWGWYGISRFEKQIPKHPNYFRGIRLRKGNIQIGDEQTLLNRKILREERANGYFLVVFFCVHPDLLPNSRRDYFNENNTLKSLEIYLKDLFHGTLHELYYTASNLRGAYKKINKATELKNEIIEKEKIGFIGDEKEKLIEGLEAARNEATEAIKKIERIEKTLESTANSALSNVVQHIKKEYQNKTEEQSIFQPINIESEKIKFRTDKLSKLTKEQRKFLNKIYIIIKRTLVPQQAEELIQKIEEELI
jgi:molecular chaperone HtpG